MKKIIFLALSIAAFSVLRAQDTLVHLTDVSVTASRFHQESISSTVLKLDSSKNYYSQETPAFFSKLPSVIWQSDNGTPFGYSYFTMRGMSQNRINYTMNGVPLNDGEDLSAYTSNYTDILNSVRSVQVVRGAGVSSNGASSYAGLINFDLNSPFDSASGSLSGMYGSFNSYRAAAKYSTGVKRGWGSTIRASITGSDGYRDYSSGRSSSFSGSTGWKSDKTSVRFNTIMGWTKNGQAWLPTPEGMIPKTNILSTVAAPQYDNFFQGIYQLQVSEWVNSHLLVNASPYIVFIDGNYDYPNFDSSMSTGNLALRSTNRGFYANLKWFHRNLTLQAGETINNFTREHAGTSPYSDYANKGIKNDGSLYVKASYVYGKLVFDADVQGRGVYFEYQCPEFRKVFLNTAFLNYFFGVSHQGKTLQPYISYSKSTREPTRTDFFGNFDNLSFGDSSVYFTNMVKPETVHDLEAGTKFRSPNLRGSINLYGMFFRNEILSTNQLNYLGIMMRKNVERSYRAGVEGEIVAKIASWWEAGTSFNFSHNRIWVNDEQKEPLLTPTRIVNFSSKFKRGSTWLGAEYKFVSESYLEATNKLVLPSYHMLDISLGWKINDKMTTTMFINNLLNKNWTTSGNVNYDSNGVPSRAFFYTSGINAYITFNYNF